MISIPCSDNVFKSLRERTGPGPWFLEMLRLENIFLRLGNNPLFRNLSVSVPAGGRLLVRGRSGSGKSSLLRLLLGFGRPDQGRVVVMDRVLGLDNVWALRRHMAYVSQDMELGRGRVGDFYREAFAFRANRGMGFRLEETVHLLETFDLDKKVLDQPLEKLSGGERQRVAIILTLLLHRDIYLLDEVTSALDQPLKERVARYFEQEVKATLVVVSHDPVWDVKKFQTLDLEKHGSRA